MDYIKISDNELIQIIVKDPEKNRLWREFHSRFKEIIARGAFNGFQNRYPKADRSDIDNVIQDTYYILLKNDCRVLRNYRAQNEFAFRAMLYRIAYHEGAKQGVKKSKRNRVEINGSDHIANLAQATNVQGLQKSDLKLAIKACLNRMFNKPSKVRLRHMLIYRLYAFGDLKPVDIARFRQMGVAYSTIARIIKSINGNIGPCLRQNGIG